MAKLRNILKPNMKESKHFNRFYTSLDMAEIKHQEAIKASQIKRGEKPLNGENHYIAVCGCGFEGCFVHNTFASVSKEQMLEFYKNRRKHAWRNN